jgi:hypothetical protein
MTVLLHSYVLLYRCKATHDGGRRRILILQMLAAGLLGDTSTSTNRTTMQPSEERYDIPRANFLRECSGIPRYGTDVCKHLNVFEDRRCTKNHCYNKHVDRKADHRRKSCSRGCSSLYELCIPALGRHERIHDAKTNISRNDLSHRHAQFISVIS